MKLEGWIAYSDEGWIASSDRQKLLAKKNLLKWVKEDNVTLKRITITIPDTGEEGKDV